MDPYRNSSEVEMSQLVLPSHTSWQTNRNNLSGGQLLKWMDTAACLAAEKHAGTSCVTASADDLTLESQILVGQVVIIKAKVNRAFNTSMEVGVTVQVEDLISSGTRMNVCQSYFTFVAQSKDGQKAKLEPSVPFTMEEKFAYSMANERRRMRLEYSSSLKTLTEQVVTKADGVSDAPPEDGSTPSVKASSTMFESVELVLPQHANHHKSTFGGQIMSWMETACTISAARLCHAQPQLRTVDEVKFRGPSRVGDRIIIRSIVNNTSEYEMEVGCRVEAYEVGGESRHINSAFFIFVVPGDNGALIKMPRLCCVSEDEKRRNTEAIARKRLRFERREIRKSVGPVISIPWTPANSKLLSYNNIWALTELYQLTEWEEIKTNKDETLFKREVDDYLCVKVTFHINIPPEDIFTLLSNEPRRKEWDPFIKESRVAQSINGEDEIVQYILESLQGGENSKPDDMVVLVSRRKPSDKSDHFIIAYRSIILSSLPPPPEYHRAENLCSGWLIKSSDERKNETKMTYINQTTRHIIPYLFKDMTGGTNVYATRIKSLKRFLKQNISSSKICII